MGRTQQPLLPIWLTRTLLVGLGLIFVLMPIHAFLSTWGGTSIGPLWLWKSWKELLVVCMTLLTLGWMISVPQAAKQILRQPLALGIMAYLLVSVVVTAVYWQENGANAVLAGVAMNLRYLGIAALAYLLFRYGQISDAWLRRGQWFVVCAGVSVAVLGILQILVVPHEFLGEFGYEKGETIAPYLLIDDNPELLRAFATLRGPNDFGAFLILPIILVIGQFRRQPLWVTSTMLVFLLWAIVLSSSRSAWVGLVVAVAAYAVYTFGRKISLTYWVGIAAALFVAAAGLFYASTHVAVLRQAIFHSSPGDSSLTEGSTDQHLTATLNGAGRVLDKPFGCGVGCAGPASYYGDDAKISENYFVQIAEETGFIGLALFMGIVGYTGYRLAVNKKQRYLSRALLVTLLGYVAIGMLLHVWSDDPLSITWWLLAGAVIGYNEKSTWKKSKGSSRSKTSSSS